MTAEQPPTGEEPDQVVRGLFRGVVRIRPPVVRAAAAVPGALSVPRNPPRSWPRLASRAMVFPRRGHPVTTEEAPGPGPATLRTAAPGDGLAVPVAGGDGAPGVRNKALLRRLALPAVTAAVAAFAAGAGYLGVTDRPPGAGDVGRWGALPVTAVAGASGPISDPSGSDPSGSDPSGSDPSGRNPFGRVAAQPVGAPTRLRIKAIGVDTPLEQLHLDSKGALQPPKTFGKAGWYAEGTVPGDIGPAVLAGHVDSKSGPAVFYRLRELTTGDRIEVMSGGAVLAFTVTRTVWYPKAKFGTEQVYGPTPDRQLRLITCGGVFDRSLRSYRDNLVVYAVAG